MGKEKFTEWFNQNWWQTKEIIGEVPFNFIIELTWKWIEKETKASVDGGLVDVYVGRNDFEICIDENGVINKRYTKEWSESGVINMDKLPGLIASEISQKKRMLQYIEALHKKFEEIIKKNNICPICYTANCGSDHK